MSDLPLAVQLAGEVAWAAEGTRTPLPNEPVLIRRLVTPSNLHEMYGRGKVGRWIETATASCSGERQLMGVSGFYRSFLSFVAHRLHEPIPLRRAPGPLSVLW